MLGYVGSFATSGALVAGAKYVSRWMDPALAPVVAGLPLGIIGSLFVAPEAAKRRYYAGFMYSSIVLAICVIKIYVVSLIFPSISMNTLSAIGLLLWGAMSWLVIYFILIRKS